jgi:AcrR family transcriptional regulator
MARPRGFDEEQALDSAMRLFWTHGYEGTSMSALTEAMGINKPSLYATFGNKEELFRRALDRYAEGPGAAVVAALALPTAREVALALFHAYARAPADPGRPLGCLLVNGAQRCGPESEPAQKEVSARRAFGVAALQKRLARAQREGDLRKDVSAADLARYVWTTLHGMAVMAADGVTSAQLERVAAIAMASWPD